MRRSAVIAIVLLGAAVLLIGTPSLFVSPDTDEVAPGEAPSPEIVTLSDSDSGFWPYLNAQETHQNRSPLNVIVRGDADRIVSLLADHGDGNWDEAEHDHFDAGTLLGGNETNSSMDPDTDENSTLEDLQPIRPTDIPWSRADGTTRYAYVDPGPDAEPYWTTETMQLEDGDYYGQRYHVRLYESPTPDDQWVVMQAHTEHFDWFTLRHRVDGVEAAQSRLEADLMAIPRVDIQEDVRRTYLGNQGPSDADGWATKVDLTAMVLALGLAARNAPRRRATSRQQGRLERARRTIDGQLTDADRSRLAAAAERVELGHLVLAVTVVSIVLGVRLAGVTLDTHTSLAVHTIAALLYPMIALGLPATTFVIAGRLERRLDAGIVAAGSLAVAIWLDYGLLGVDTLSVDVVLQRTLVVLALGLIAAGGASRSRRVSDLLAAGLALWTLVLVGTLFGYL